MDWYSFPLFFLYPPCYSIIGRKKFHRCDRSGIWEKYFVGLLVNFKLGCVQIILGISVVSCLLDNWLEVREKGGINIDVFRSWCVLWGGLATYLQLEPLKCKASLLPNILSKPWAHSGIGGAGGQQQRFQDNFPDLEILSWWEETGS